MEGTMDTRKELNRKIGAVKQADQDIIKPLVAGCLPVS